VLRDQRLSATLPRIRRWIFEARSSAPHVGDEAIEALQLCEAALVTEDRREVVGDFPILQAVLAEELAADLHGAPMHSFIARVAPAAAIRSEDIRCVRDLETLRAEAALEHRQRRVNQAIRLVHLVASAGFVAGAAIFSATGTPAGHEGSLATSWNWPGLTSTQRQARSTPHRWIAISTYPFRGTRPGRLRGAP